MGFALEDRAGFAVGQVEIGLKPSAFCCSSPRSMTCWPPPADYAPAHPKTCRVGLVRPAQVRESDPRPRRPRLRVQSDTEPPRKRGKGSPFSNSI